MKHNSIYRDLLIILSAILWSISAMPATSVFEEYQLKTALLYKLTSFVAWPKHEKTLKSFKICLVGLDNFGKTLDTLEGSFTNNTPITVHRYAGLSTQQLECQVIFISLEDKQSLGELLRTLAPFPILTVGDTDGFAASGGMIQLSSHDGQIKFDINLHEAKTANLQIAAPLLQLSHIINPNRKESIK